MSIGDYSDNNDYGNAYYYCTKNIVNTTYSCPEKFDDNYSYRLAGTSCKCSANIVPIFMKLCPDVASSDADAKLMIFVKDKNNSQYKSMKNQFINIANANLEYAIPMSSTPDTGEDISKKYYLNNGENQSSYSSYSKYSKAYDLSSAVDYTGVPYNKVSSLFCQMDYCTVDVSDLSKIDNYDELDASEKLRVTEIAQALTDDAPFQPYIINAANTMSYEPIKADGVSLFTSCGSDDCASAANMYVNQQGACSAHNVAVDYVPMTTDSNMKAIGNYSKLWVFYNPDTLDNHKPTWTYPNTSVVTNDCYASTKAAIEAEKLYDRFNSIYKQLRRICIGDGSNYSEFWCDAYILNSDLGLCRAWYGNQYRGHRCCVGRDSLDNIITSDPYPASLCEHQKELDYTQYLYMQQLVTPEFYTSDDVEITYERCQKVLSDYKGYYPSDGE